MVILYRKEIHEEIKFDMGKSNTTDTSASLSDKILTWLARNPQPPGEGGCNYFEGFGIVRP